MAGRVLLVEGLDLAGKSTLVGNLQRELARGIPVRVSRNALCPDNPIAVLADQVRRDPSRAGRNGGLFLAAHLWERCRALHPAAGRHGSPSGLLLAADAGVSNTWKDTPAMPEQLARAARHFPRFDAAVFLTAGIEERRRRLAQREGDQPGSNDSNDHLVHSDRQGFLLHERVLWGLTRSTRRRTG